MKLKHPVVHGHPLHAMLSDLPAALIPAALLAAAVERARPDERTRYAARTSTLLAFGAACLAGVVGWWDWLTIPGDHPVRSPATKHGLINTAGLAVGAAAILAPRRRLELLVVLNAALLVAAWIGGDLVYRLGWRVRPAEELEQIDAGKPRDDARAIVDKHELEDVILS
jgi:uncharacterized membrane protein